MQGVANALGGVNNNTHAMPNLGMHFINDPNFLRDPCSTTPLVSPNVVARSDGCIFATRRIFPEEELLLSYNLPLAPYR